MYRKLFTVLVALLVLPAMLFAGTTGKIKGKVTDRENGEPLPGANIVVDGTTLGAASDLNGEFIILNVPSGVYAVNCSFVGYQTATISNLKVSADLTTEADFKLASEAIELAAVQVVAERPLVNKNATNAVRIATQEDMKNLPLRGVNNAVALQAGVVQIGNDFHVRGSRADETAFFIEGAGAGSAITGDNARVIPEALEEFQVQAGGYNAEYGGANAGIVRQTLRSGTSDYHLSLQAETDRHTNQFDDGFLNTYSYGYSNYVGTFSGPLWGDKVKLFLAGENEFFRDRFVRFVDGFAILDAKDSGKRQGATGQSVPGSNVGGSSSNDLVVKSGNIPHASQNRYTGNGTLTFDLKPIVFRLSGSQSWVRFTGTTEFIEQYFALERLALNDQSTGLYNLKATQVINPKTFYEVNLSYYDRRTKGYDPLFEDDMLAYNDSLRLAEFGYERLDYDSSPREFDIYGFPFDRRGQTLALYSKGKQNYYAASGFLTTQWRAHEIKVGGGYQYWTYRNYNGYSGGLSTMRTNPDVVRTEGLERDVFFTRQLGARNIGYDPYGNEIDDDTPAVGIDGPKHPQFWNAYLQDKFEAKDLVVNFGFRYDHFDLDDFVFLNPRDPAYNTETLLFENPDSSIEKAKTFDEFSPRLGLAFPVTDRTVFHLQFGRFVQVPQLNTFYRAIGNYQVNFGGQNFIAAPHGNGIEPERTLQYEVGFSQQISDNFAFDMTAFYKDIRGQLQIRRVTTVSGSGAAPFNALQNGDFATTRGLELALTLRRTQRVQANVSYTLSDSRGTGSTTNSAVSGIEAAGQLPTIISPLDFEQRHRGAINLDYRFGKGDSGPILERLGFNALFSFNSGHPYTLSGGSGGQLDVNDGGILNNGDPRTRTPLEPINSSTTPWNFSLDLRLDKTVSFGKINANFYVYSTNVFNSENVINVYQRTGNAYDDGYLTDPGAASVIAGNGGANYINAYQAINIANRQHQIRQNGPDLFGTPRQVRFGVNVQY